MIPKMASTHTEGLGRDCSEGFSRAATSRWRDRYGLNPIGPNGTNRRNQIGVTGNEQMDFGPLARRLDGVHDHLYGEIHVGLLLGVEFNLGTAVGTYAHLRLVFSPPDYETSAVLFQRLEIDVLSTRRLVVCDQARAVDNANDIKGHSQRCTCVSSERIGHALDIEPTELQEPLISEPVIQIQTVDKRRRWDSHAHQSI